MAQALDAAWTRSLASAESRGRLKQAQADQRVAGSWLAGPPTLELAQREGRGSAADGARETDVGIALPLWRLGQRGQNVEAAEAESAWASAAEQAARLRLASQVREQANKVKLSEFEVQQAAQQRQLLEELSADVDRRVKAGDLAPADALAAKAEMLSARALEREAQQAHVAQRSAWTLLTGLVAVPEPDEFKAQEAATLDEHVEAKLAEAAVQRARHRLAQAQAQRGAPPELGIGLRQERPGLGQARQNSVALSLRVPFGTEIHNLPRLATAMAEEDLALAAQQRLRMQLEAELALAQSHLAASQAQAAAEQERAALLRERAQLLKKSFQAGESSLPELLRALAAAGQASAASARQQAALAQAQARLHQALGQLP
jgi:outer membrane protein TolC